MATSVALPVNGSLADLPRAAPMEERPKVYGWPTSENGYTIQEVPSGTKRPRKAIVIGAGASGLNFAKFQQDQMANFDCVIYEKNDEVSGTWTENRYPYVLVELFPLTILPVNLTLVIVDAPVIFPP